MKRGFELTSVRGAASVQLLVWDVSFGQNINMKALMTYNTLFIFIYDVVSVRIKLHGRT